jgi:mono/diheme cytochrome c family protein
MRISAKSIILGILALVVVLVLGGITAVGWQIVLGPDARPVSSEKFEATEARLERGKYLVEGVSHCFLCHSEHDFSTPDYPSSQTKKGAGWVMPIPELNYIASRNITPDVETGIGSWSDDEIARAIREGVRKDGSALFPVMPYLDFRTYDDEDVKSIVVYLRTIPAVKNAVPKRNLPARSNTSSRRYRSHSRRRSRRIRRARLKSEASTSRRSPVVWAVTRRLTTRARCCRASSLPAATTLTTRAWAESASSRRTLRPIRQASRTTTKRGSSRRCTRAAFRDGC